MTWNFRAFTLFGIAVRIHWTLLVYFLLVASDHLFHFGTPWLGYVLALLGLTFLAVLLHEFGHCWAARRCGLSADEVVLWPLGGAAYIGGGGSPATDVFVAAAGPAVNILICGIAGVAMSLRGDPWDWQILNVFAPYYTGRILPDLFRMSWFMFAFNVAIPAYPMDGGRILQGVLAARMGFERATYAVTGLAMAVAGVIVVAGVLLKNILLALIGIFVFVQALQTRRLLREGALEGYSQFTLGHDFSMGYTSLEREERARRRRPPGFFARLRQRRSEARARRLREEEARIRLRVDQLLDKVSGGGIGSLTPDERRFLEEASRRLQEFDALRKG